VAVSNPFVPLTETDPRPGLTRCRLCPRLVAWREEQAGHVPPRYRQWVGEHGFWGRPVPAFGDRGAWLAIVGLAPAAQGANRTGRMFTGDRSGDFLFAALYRAGLASRPRSDHAGDGLRLDGVLITAPLRCAPPGNRPLGDELDNCRPYLAADLVELEQLRVVLALGRLAHAAVVRLVRTGGGFGGAAPRFAHGAEFGLTGGMWLVDSFHVSQQNTFTGRLTAAMFDRVLERCGVLADQPR
jgi:uracil-DNA glycosylase family 4